MVAQLYQPREGTHAGAAWGPGCSESCSPPCSDLGVGVGLGGGSRGFGDFSWSQVHDGSGVSALVTPDGLGHRPRRGAVRSLGGYLRWRRLGVVDLLQVSLQIHERASKAAWGSVSRRTGTVVRTGRTDRPLARDHGGCAGRGAAPVWPRRSRGARGQVWQHARPSAEARGRCRRCSNPSAQHTCTGPRPL